MLASALKSISASNITANYALAPAPAAAAGPWKIYEAKKKSTGKSYSLFLFDRKSLDAHAAALGRSGAAAYRRALQELIERLKKEASSLAKLRHPNILELVEPVEETRSGGLQFVTEPVVASLASLLQSKDDPAPSPSRRAAQDGPSLSPPPPTDLELDELEIQKGLLQLAKALEFLHDHAGLLHGNLTPDAVLINAKSDWKLSGLAFCSAPDNSSKPSSIPGISLHEVLNPDPRLPSSVRLNLDYSSPDFVMDNNLNSSADIFSLGLLSIALYNSPHQSPLQCHGSLSSYKRLFSSSSTIPSSNNNFLSTRPLPPDLVKHVLPRLITRRPAQRMTAREFQQSEYFDNILVSTIRFLDTFPAKTAGEKTQFLRGLGTVLPSFPASVMEKKILPALLEELKDRQLLSLLLQNVFKIVDLLPSARPAFAQYVRPALKDVLVVNTKQTQDKDAARDAGLMVFLEHISTVADNCSGRDLKEDMLPVLLAAIECPTHSIVDAALRTLPSVLPILDFSTIKNELFPVVAAVFSRTNSLSIKVRGLQAFVVLCGGSAAAQDGAYGDDGDDDDGLNGLASTKKSSTSSALDKYTMQEKIVPLIRAIKTKEPAVMMAALRVLRIVGRAADADFVALDLLPLLWGMSLGPLLDLGQFKAFMDLIKSLSRRVEDEQATKLQETSRAANGSASAVGSDFIAFGGLTGTAYEQRNDGGGGAAGDDDFEALVKGTRRSDGGPSLMNDGFSSWDETPAPPSSSSANRLTSGSAQVPAFSWSTPSSATTATGAPGAGRVGSKPDGGFGSAFGAAGPKNLGRFEALTPTSTQFSQPLQPTRPGFGQGLPSHQQQGGLSAASFSTTSLDWSSAAKPWTSTATGLVGSASASLADMRLKSSPGSSGGSSFSLPPPPRPATGTPGAGAGASGGSTDRDQPKSGLQRYESLI